MYRENVSFVDRIIAGLSYFTYGFVGAVWLIMSFIMKKDVSIFLKYHVYMAIFLYLAVFLVSVIIGIFSEILSIVPFLKVLIRQISYVFNSPVYMNYSIIQLFIYTLILYLIVTALLGIFSYVPWVSRIISEITDRRY